MKRLLSFLILLGTACAPSIAPNPSPVPRATQTATSAPLPSEMPIPTLAPTPLGGGSGNMLLLDGSSVYNVDLSHRSESVVADVQDLVPADLAFDPQDTLYSAEFSPDAQKILLVLRSSTDKTWKQVVLADSNGSHSVSLPLDLQDRLGPTVLWAPDGSSLIVKLSEKYSTNTGPEHWVVSARPEDFGQMLQWEPAFALFWSGDSEKIYSSTKEGYFVARKDGSDAQAIQFSGDSCQSSRMGVASLDGGHIYLRCEVGVILEAGPNGEDSHRVEVPMHPEYEVMYWSAPAQRVVMSNGSVWSAFPEVSLYSAVRGTSQIYRLEEKMTVPCGLSPDGRSFIYLANYFDIPSVMAYPLEERKAISIYQSKQKKNAQQFSCPGWIP